MDDSDLMNVDDLMNINANRVEQDDTVVYLGKGAKPKLGVVSKVYRGSADDSSDKSKEDGVVIDVFPGSVGSVVRSEDEIYVTDRGFSLSESVVRINNPKQIGFVRQIHVKADVIVLPERKIVAQNVDLSTAKFIEPFASGGQNFLLFGDWIGTALKSVFELTVVFRNCYRCKIKDNVDSGILYRRKDYGVGRQWVPGETVMVSTSYVISNKAEWETEIPSCLLKRKSRGYSHHTPFVIEKVSLYAVKVRWLTTPSASIEPPPERITKPDVDRIIKLDTLEYTQALCGDRMKMKPDDRVTVMRKTDWEKILAEELIEKLPEQAFKGRRRRMKKFLSSSSSSSSCSTRTSTNSMPLKKRPSTSFLSSTHDQESTEGDRYNDIDDKNSNKLGAGAANESMKASFNSASGYDNTINSDSANNELSVAINNNHEEGDMVCDNDENTANSTSRLLNDTSNDNQPAAAANRQQAQLMSKMEIGAEVEVSSTSPKSQAVDQLSPLRFVKKNKPTTFNIRQIRRNKQNRAMKRKAARSRIQLDMRSCLGEEFYGDIMRTYSTVDVVWMDGTIENNISGIDLVPYELDLDHHDDVPGTIVARKINAEKEGEYGIVMSADTEKRLATVQWYLYDWKQPNSEPVATEKELCSLFDLMLHPTYQGLWWGSLCLRTSKESSDVRDLIGQLITTNENGKNTVAWFNGTTEEVWPIEITILVTNEEMDLHFDEDGTDSEDDETWNSIDSNDDDSDIDVINDPTLDSSGLSLSITIAEIATNNHDLFSMNGRILIPQDVLKVKISGDKAIQSKILEDDMRSPSEGWLKTVRGQSLNLSEILAILKETEVEFKKKNSIDSREVLARINFIIICLKNSTLALHYTMNEFFFTYIEERVKLNNNNESRAKASLTYMIESFEEMITNENCKLVLDEDHKSSSLTIDKKQFSFSAGMLFFEKLFNDWIVELRSIFSSMNDTSITLDSNNQPTFFHAFDFLQCSPFKLTWDGSNEGSETSKNKKKETPAADGLKTDISKEDSQELEEKNNEDNENNCDKASQGKRLSFECHISMDSFDFIDNIMPQLEESWTDLDINVIKQTLNQFIGEFLSTEGDEHDIDDKTDEQANSVKKEDRVKKLAVGDNDDNKSDLVTPNFNELSKKDDKMMYSVASALSTYLLTLLYNILCSSNENHFLASYGHVESNLRKILHYYYSAKTDELLEKEKGKSRICWDNVMERIVEKWYMESMNFTNSLKATLKNYFNQITNRIKLVSNEASETDSLLNTASKQTENKAETTDVEMEGDENQRKPSDDIKMNEEETEADCDAKNHRVLISSSVAMNEDRSRRFPSLEFISEAPSTHAFHSKSLCADRQFMRCVHKELDLLSKHLPDGIFVRAFEDRLDLLSLVIIGPRSTPFEDVPLFFDVYLPATYPAEPPLVHYWAFSQEQLNPNLYQTGKICVSLLGTWNGKGSEQWTSESNLLQVFLSIQGLILVAEPYFNEAGYESRKNAPVAVERSRRYNEMALVNSLDYFYRIMRLPPKGFEQLIKEHCQAVLPSIRKRIWLWQSGEAEPEFPLCPISEGCKLSLRKMTVILGTVSEGSSKEVDEKGDADASGMASSSLSDI